MQHPIRAQARPAKEELPTHSRLLAKRMSCLIMSLPSLFTAPLVSNTTAAKSNREPLNPASYTNRHTHTCVVLHFYTYFCFCCVNVSIRQKVLCNFFSKILRQRGKREFL